MSVLKRKTEVYDMVAGSGGAKSRNQHLSHQCNNQHNAIGQRLNNNNNRRHKDSDTTLEQLENYNNVTGVKASEMTSHDRLNSNHNVSGVKASELTSHNHLNSNHNAKEQKTSEITWGVELTSNNNIILHNPMSSQNISSNRRPSFYHTSMRDPDQQVCTALGGSPMQGMISQSESVSTSLESQTPRSKPVSKKSSKIKNKKKPMLLKRLLVLILVFVVFVSIGAAIFNALEAGPEEERRDKLQAFVKQFLANHSCVSQKEMYEVMNMAVQDSEIVYYVVNNKTRLDRWDFSGSFGFVVSVVTTIGFGNLAPATMEGRIACVLYAMIGIPLTLLMLGGIGENMVQFFTRVREMKLRWCSREANRIINVILVASIGLTIMFIAPALTFTYVERWDFLESMYFCFTTLSTIGFGDYILAIHETRIDSYVLHELYKVFSTAWILVGLSYLSLFYRYITDSMVAGSLKMEKNTIKRLADFNPPIVPDKRRVTMASSSEVVQTPNASDTGEEASDASQHSSIQSNNGGAHPRHTARRGSSSDTYYDALDVNHHCSSNVSFIEVSSLADIAEASHSQSISSDSNRDKNSLRENRLNEKSPTMDKLKELTPSRNISNKNTSKHVNTFIENENSDTPTPENIAMGNKNTTFKFIPNGTTSHDQNLYELSEIEKGINVSGTTVDRALGPETRNNVSRAERERDLAQRTTNNTPSLGGERPLGQKTTNDVTSLRGDRPLCRLTSNDNVPEDRDWARKRKLSDRRNRASPNS